MENKLTHKHMKIAEHSPQQKAMFFALSSQLGYNTDEVKKRAIKKFKHECFNEIRSGEINQLIEILLAKIEENKKTNQRTTLCYQCREKPAIFNDYYCSQDCQDKYYPLRGGKPTMKEMQMSIVKNAKGIKYEEDEIIHPEVKM